MSRLSEKGRLKVIETNKKVGTFAKYNKTRSSLPGYVNPMKGKKRPDLVERNRKRKGSGNPKPFVSEETKTKNRSEAKLGIKNPMYGKKRPNFSGENHPNWKGGQENRQGWRRGNEWQKMRKTVIIRDEFTCKNCGIIDVRFDVHHIKPYVKYPNLKLDITNLTTLCKDCHKEKHKCH